MHECLADRLSTLSTATIAEALDTCGLVEVMDRFRVAHLGAATPGSKR